MSSIQEDMGVTDEQGILNGNILASPIFGEIPQDDIHERDLLDHNRGNRGKAVGKKLFKS